MQGRALACHEMEQTQPWNTMQDKHDIHKLLREYEQGYNITKVKREKGRALL